MIYMGLFELALLFYFIQMLILVSTTKNLADKEKLWN